MERDYENNGINPNRNEINSGYTTDSTNDTNTNIKNQPPNYENQESNQYSQEYNNMQDFYNAEDYNTQFYDEQYGNSGQATGAVYDTYQYQDASNQNEAYSNTTYSYVREEIPQDNYGNTRQGFTEEPVFQVENDEKETRKKGRKVVKFMATAAAFGIIASVAFLGANEVYYGINPSARHSSTAIEGGNSSKNASLSLNQGGNANSIATTTVSNGGVIYNTDVSDVVEETMPSIVAITSTVTQSYNDWFGQNYEQDVEGSGSGIIVGKNDNELLIVTNNHVVDGAKAIAVQFIDKETYQAEIKGKDSTADLAVIAVKLNDISNDTMGKIKIATLGNSDDIKVGQMAIAIGNALGYGQSTTVGYISATEREVTIENSKMTLLQTDAAINPGNSGGALLNVAGEVIGINSVKYADSSVEGMGFAIPITRAMPIINDLMNREKIAEGEEGFLGISGGTVPSDMIKGYGWPEGVYIDSVLEGGPAQASGIISRDIVTKVNDASVSTMEAMQEKISGYPAGTKVTITVQRLENGQFVEKTFEVTLKRKTDVVKEDTATSNNSNSNKGTLPENDLGNNGQDNNQDYYTEDPNGTTDPFSDFFGENGTFQIPGYGN